MIEDLGRLRGFDVVRDQLIENYNRVRRERASDALYESLAEQYQIVIEGMTIPDLGEPDAVDNKPQS